MAVSRAMKQTLFGTIAALGGPAVLRRIHRGKAAILMYHSIVDTPPIAWTQIHVKDFRRQMEHLSRSTTLISMSELSRRLMARDIDPFTTAVTFDDGFANFASLALPVLQEFQIPATVYLATSLIDGQNAFNGLVWPDYVHSLFLSTKLRSLDLTEYSLPRYEISSDLARHEACFHLCKHLKQIPTNQWMNLIQIVADRLETGVLPEYREMFAGMTWDQVRQIDNNRLIEFGAHTVNHVILSQSSDDEMRGEILQSKRIIEKQLGHPIELFAYPNGRQEDYNDNIVNLVRTVFISAVTTSDGLATPAHDMHTLPRLGIGSDMFFSKYQLFVSGIMEWQK
jgi:peptidoglycan/xylan/chitin deacetylase (PgdA/CDA1 family)